ncbi:hypothetical protein C8F01DRAFT_1079458 [Mycena amicta]|nr:hypothetical protein C8F01DRAFT_1079458 [Mycena amicta]
MHCHFAGPDEHRAIDSREDKHFAGLALSVAAAGDALECNQHPTRSYERRTLFRFVVNIHPKKDNEPVRLAPLSPDCVVQRLQLLPQCAACSDAPSDKDLSPREKCTESATRSSVKASCWGARGQSGFGSMAVEGIIAVVTSHLKYSLVIAACFLPRMSAPFFVRNLHPSLQEELKTLLERSDALHDTNPMSPQLPSPLFDPELLRRAATRVDREVVQHTALSMEKQLNRWRTDLMPDFQVCTITISCPGPKSFCQMDTEPSYDLTRNHAMAALSRTDIDCTFVIQKATECIHLSPLKFSPDAGDIVSAISEATHGQYLRYKRRFIEGVDALVTEPTHRILANKIIEFGHERCAGVPVENYPKLTDVELNPPDDADPDEHLHPGFNTHWATQLDAIVDVDTRDRVDTDQNLPDPLRRDGAINSAPSEEAHRRKVQQQRDAYLGGAENVVRDLFKVPNETLYEMVAERQSKPTEMGHKVGMFQLLLNQLFAMAHDDDVYDSVIRTTTSEFRTDGLTADVPPPNVARFKTSLDQNTLAGAARALETTFSVGSHHNVTAETLELISGFILRCENLLEIACIAWTHGFISLRVLGREAVTRVSRLCTNKTSLFAEYLKMISECSWLPCRRDMLAPQLAFVFNPQVACWCQSVSNIYSLAGQNTKLAANQREIVFICLVALQHINGGFFHPDMLELAAMSIRMYHHKCRLKEHKSSLIFQSTYAAIRRVELPFRASGYW